MALSLLAVGVLVVGVVGPLQAHAQSVSILFQESLERLFPTADRFEDRSGDPPAFEAYSLDTRGGEERLVGYAFLTSDFPPEQRGFDGAIQVLVGMDLQGVLTGVEVTKYNESLQKSRGDFLAADGFQEQFGGKRIVDAFQVRRDVDGITGATITVDAMARGVRNAAREFAIARGLGSLSPPSESGPAHPASVTPEDLTELTWTEMVAGGLAQQFPVLDRGRAVAELTLTYLNGEEVAEVVIGPTLLEGIREQAGSRLDDRHLVVAGVDGPFGGALNLVRLSIVQDGDTISLGTDDVLLYGSPREGKLDGQVRFVRALLYDGSLDMTRPLTFVLDLRPGLGVFTGEYPGQPEPIGLATSVVSDGASPGPGGEAEESVLSRLLVPAPWGRVAGLLVLLSLATAAFVTKRTVLRWTTLLATLLFLGFVDRGFLSVSHVTSAIRVGPSVFLADLPLLIMVTFTLVTTLLWGRVFCGFLCPFGVLQDILERIVPRRRRHVLSAQVHRRAFQVKYAVLALVVLPVVAGSGISLFHWFEPFGTVFFLSRSPLLWTIAVGFLAASAVIPRFYCRYACPLGAALALGSWLSPFRIRRVEQCSVCKVCEQRCPTRAIDGARLDFRECVRCNVCEQQLAQKAGVCRHDMAEVRSRLGLPMASVRPVSNRTTASTPEEAAGG